MNTKREDVKKVLITGVSRGIGKATAEKFLEEGWQVLGTSTSGQAPIKDGNLKLLKLELLDSRSIQSLFEEIDKAAERLDVLINNAGASYDRGAGFISIEILRKTLEVNLIGLIDLTQRLLPHINDGGHIINISSGSGSLTEFRGSWAPAYSISKASLNMYTRILAGQLRNRNITVSSLTPGWVRTDMGGPGAPRDPKEPAREIYDLANSKVESGFFWSQGHKRDW
jgi:NAD(P)-dependent dehydrogenase (short-subunit alcohol dehydrogenase family)